MVASRMDVIPPDAIPPPRKEDVLFVFDRPTSTLWYSLLGAYDLAYADAYLTAARVLVDHVEKVRKDNLVYPIVFLYRHHIELVLKNIIGRAPYLLDRPLTEAEKQHLGDHRLDLLWQDLKPLFGNFCKLAGWGEFSAAEEAAIDSYIGQLTALDRRSLSFRYARSTKGTPTLGKDFDCFNLHHFTQMMERLTHYLDELDKASLDLEDTKREMEGEYGYDL